MARVEFGFAPIDLSSDGPFVDWINRIGQGGEAGTPILDNERIAVSVFDADDGSIIDLELFGRFSYGSESAFLNSRITGIAFTDRDGSYSMTVTGLPNWSVKFYLTNDSIAALEALPTEVVGSALGDTLEGGDGAKDTLLGNGGDDILRGLGGDDSLLGSDGNDTLDGGAGSDAGEGGAGDDWVIVRFDEAGKGDVWNGGDGIDTISIELDKSGLTNYAFRAEIGRLADHLADPLLAGQTFASKHLALTATGFEDWQVTYTPKGTVLPHEAFLFDRGGFGAFLTGVELIVGSGGNDLLLAVGIPFSSSPPLPDVEATALFGSSLFSYSGLTFTAMQIGYIHDHMVGGSGADALLAGVGEDVLYGGARGDVLEGGTDADVFRFGDWLHSRPGAEDLILDFEQGVDHIDVAGVDAIAFGRNDDFVFIGSGDFTAAGQLRAVQNGDDVRIEGETTGDGAADFAIIVQDAIAADFAADDFFGLA